MSYDPSVPTGPQFFSASQPIIQGNFNKANSDFGVDHKPFTTGVGAGEGEHTKVTFNNIQAVPPVTFVAPKGELFTRASAGPNVFSDLFWGAKGSTTPALNAVPLAKLTGGGITTACWGTFDLNQGSGQAPIASVAVLDSYNVANIAYAGGGTPVVTVSFSRPFLNINYMAFLGSSNASNPSGTISGVATLATGSMNFTISVGASVLRRYQFLCFGTLQ